MNHKSLKSTAQFILLVIGLCSSSIVQAQDYNAPNSIFGIGDLTNSNFMMTRGMGNLGASFADEYNMNPVNPASYSYLKLTNFTMAFSADYARISDSKYSENRWRGSLDYFGLAFPLRNYKNAILDPVKRNFEFGMAFYLKPYSDVSYNISTLQFIEGAGNIARKYFGEGGTYTAGWGNSVKYKDFSFGINLGYIFGKIENTQHVDIKGENNTFRDVKNATYNMRGLDYKIGAMYRLKLNAAEVDKDQNIALRTITFGVHGKTATGFKTSGMFSHTGVNLKSGAKDTLALNETITGTGSLPLSLGGGMTYTHGTQWSLGVDAEYTAWSNFKNTIRPDYKYQDQIKFGLGGKYRPDARGFGSFLERTNYLFGMFYETDPRIVQGKSFTNYGLNLGMIMPFYYQQGYSSVAFNVSMGQRGVGSTIKENYIQMGLGLSFNDDSWFIRRKYN